MSPHRRNRHQSFSEGVKLSFILLLFTCVYEKALELVSRNLCNFLGNIQIRLFFFQIVIESTRSLGTAVAVFD